MSNKLEMEKGFVSIESDVFEGTREMLNGCITKTISDMVEKKIEKGQVNLTIKIEIDECTSNEGEVYKKPSFEIKVGKKLINSNSYSSEMVGDVALKYDEDYEKFVVEDVDQRTLLDNL